MDDNKYSGHRERMKKRFAEEKSLENFTESEIMEMLLFYIIPRKDTASVARELINRFGTVKKVLDADVSQLSQINGIGESGAFSLKFFGCLNYLCCLSEKYRNTETPDTDVRNFPKMYGFVYNLFADEENSVLMALSINDNMHIQSCENLGTIKEKNRKDYNFFGRNIAKSVLKNGCENVILALNHPKKPRKPTEEDIIFTRKIMVFLRSLDITLLDCYISGKDGAVSLRQKGLIFDLDEC